MKGLIVDEPWVSLLLNRKKTWEMRSTHTATRDRIALIRKGSGTVVGVADLVDSIGPLDDIAWRAHQERHQIPLSQQAETRSWNHAWVLDSVRPLIKPVPYSHPNGAVVWVRLPEEVERSLVIAHPLQEQDRDAPKRARAVVPAAVGVAPASEGPRPSAGFVPVARDGSWFSPDLLRAGAYRIGPKGEEIVVETYAEALDQLRLMKSPHWRRPNSNGNWGIVTGVRWMSASELSQTNYASEHHG